MDRSGHHKIQRGGPDCSLAVASMGLDGLDRLTEK